MKRTDGAGRAGRRKSLGLGVAASAVAIAVFGALAAHAATQAADRDPAGGDSARIETVKAAGLGWTMPQAGDPAAVGDPHLIDRDARRMAAWGALAALAASAVSLFGVNRILNMLVSVGRGLGRNVGKAGASAARASARVAGSAAKATAKATAGALKKPGGWLMTIAGLTIFALTGVAFLDIQWEAGLLAGAGLSAATMWGWRKSGDLINRTLAPLSSAAAFSGSQPPEPANGKA